MKSMGSSTTWVVPSRKACLSRYTTCARSLTERRSFDSAGRAISLYAYRVGHPGATRKHDEPS